MYQAEDFSAAEQRDPVISAIYRLAEKFGFTPPLGLFNMLPRDGAGLLPYHQAGPALDLIGLNHERSIRKKLPQRPEFYPALVQLESGSAIAVLELADNDLLVWRDGLEEPQWVPFAEIEAEFGGDLLTVMGNPDKLREIDAPWHAKAREHWFWSELHKERHAFRPVLVASLLINFLALSLPLF